MKNKRGVNLIQLFNPLLFIIRGRGPGSAIILVKKFFYQFIKNRGKKIELYFVIDYNKSVEKRITYTVLIFKKNYILKVISSFEGKVII